MFSINVSGVYRGDVERHCFIQVTEEECLKAGAKNDDILELVGDITKEDVQDKLINETVKKFGKLDILVNFFTVLKF